MHLFVQIFFKDKLVEGIKVLMAGLLLFSGPASNAQENIWIFGRGTSEGAGLDFNTIPPTPIPSNIGGWGEASASITDVHGNLLFYTNGDDVWDSNHTVMPNGADLTGLPLTNNGDSPCSSSTQGTLVMPVPGSGSRYYVFSLSARELDTLKGRLYYSVVDMNLNAGLGDVISGAKNILLDSMLGEKMTAIPGNHCNIWLIVHEYYPSNTFHAWEVTSDGIMSSPVISNVGNLTNDIGWFSPSPNGTKLLAANFIPVHGGLELFDINPNTGELYNPVVLDNAFNLYYGGAFSPDGTKIYASSLYQLYQFDLNSANPANTKTTLGFCATAAVKLGPDDRIYTAHEIGEHSSLSFVMFPNLPGTACGYVEDTIKLLTGTVSWVGFPNTVPVIKSDSFYSLQSIAGSCFADRLTLRTSDPDAGWDYVWNTGVTGPEMIADTPGTYWVNYHTPPCNYHTDTFQVDFPNGVLPTIYTMAECRSDSNGYAYAYTYDSDPVTYSYTWLQGTDTLSLTDTLAGVPSGDYRLHVQTNMGCDTLLFFDIPEEDFRVSFRVSDTLICVGDAIEISNTSDAHFTNYHWAFGNGDTADLPDPPPYVYPESGAYRIMLSGAGEICKDTAYQTILVDQPLLPAFEVEPKAVCVGRPVYFYPTTDSTTVQLAWEMDEQLWIENNVQQRYLHGFTFGGTFPVTLKLESRACPDTSITDSIRVYALPEVDLGDDSSICLQGQPLYLKNLREAPLTAYHQVWSTGDTTAVLKVVHPGIYTLRVTTEPIGCTTTESIEITKACYIDMPNAFTPNGDGNNDYFLPRQLLSESISRFQMQVYNRWGQLLFETTNLDGRGWDGRFNGQVQPMGVYLYRIEAEFDDGRQEQYEGNVTLLR